MDSQFLLTSRLRMCHTFCAAYANRQYNNITELTSCNEYQNGTWYFSWISSIP